MRENGLASLTPDDAMVVQVDAGVPSRCGRRLLRRAGSAREWRRDLPRRRTDPGDWPAERVDSFYREYNSAMVVNLIVHEAMPGHALQLAHGRRFSGSTPVRQVFMSGSFIEGWAVHAERLMAEAGHGGARGQAPAAEDADPHDDQRDPRRRGPCGRDDRESGDRPDDRPRVPGRG